MILSHGVCLAQLPFYKKERRRRRFPALGMASKGLKKRGGQILCLSGNKYMRRYPPLSLFQQFTVLHSVEHHVVVSIRKDSAQHHTLTGGTKGWISFANVRTALNSGAVDLRKSQRMLAFMLLEAVLDQNLLCQDKLKGWLRQLELQINDAPLNKHVSHLYAFMKVVDAYQKHMSLVNDLLDPENFGRLPAARFYHEEEPQFRTLSTELQTSAHEISTYLTTAKELQALYRTLQEDKMNRVLYVLTLTTAVFIPAQFMTGLYGMNFGTGPPPTSSQSGGTPPALICGF